MEITFDIPVPGCEIAASPWKGNLMIMCVDALGRISCNVEELRRIYKVWYRMPRTNRRASERTMTLSGEYKREVENAAVKR